MSHGANSGCVTNCHDPATHVRRKLRLASSCSFCNCSNAATISSSFAFLNGFASSAAFSAVAVAVSKSRSSFVLIGFCDENRMDSKINFNSMQIKKGNDE